MFDATPEEKLQWILEGLKEADEMRMSLPRPQPLLCIEEMARKMSMDIARVEDFLVRVAYDWIGMTEIAEYVLENCSLRMRTLVQRASGITLERERIDDLKGCEFGFVISVYIRGKLFDEKRVTFKV